jgi:hypothetical protein
MKLPDDRQCQVGICGIPIATSHLTTEGKPAMLRLTKQRVETLKVVDEEGVREEFLKVTPVVTLNGIESRLDRRAQITTRNGEDVNDIGGGFLETFSGIRWRLAS